MKTILINGVECAQVESYDPDLHPWRDFGDGDCALCPYHIKGCEAQCGGKAFVPLKYVPILQMRGVKFK